MIRGYWIWKWHNLDSHFPYMSTRAQCISAIPQWQIYWIIIIWNESSKGMLILVLLWLLAVLILAPKCSSILYESTFTICQSHLTFTQYTYSLFIPSHLNVSLSSSISLFLFLVLLLQQSLDGFNLSRNLSSICQEGLEEFVQVSPNDTLKSNSFHSSGQTRIGVSHQRPGVY